MTHTTTDPRRLPGRAAAEFERLYRSNFAAVTAYFARRTTDPQTVADLTSDTFVAAITSFATFDPRKGTARSWLFGVARHVFARHCEAFRRDSDIVSRLTGYRPLDAPEINFGYDDVLDAITVPTRQVPAGDLVVITVLADRAGRIEVMTIGGPPAKGEVASCLRGDEASMGIYHVPPGRSSLTPDSSAAPSVSGSPPSSSH